MADPLSSSPRNNIIENGLEERQAADIIIEVIVDVVNVVVEDIIDDIFKFENNAQAVESNFTQQMIISLGNQYPKKNRLVYHDQDSTYKFSPDAVHAHKEIDIGNILGIHEFTQGYEIWVFDYGTFSLAGGGGFINWAYGGCYTAQGTDVTFTQC